MVSLQVAAHHQAARVPHLCEASVADPAVLDWGGGQLVRAKEHG